MSLGEHADLESELVLFLEGGVKPAFIKKNLQNVKDMSVCLESSNVLANQVGTSPPEQSSTSNEATVTSTTATSPDLNENPVSLPVVLPQATKTSIAKLLVANHQGSFVGSTTAPVLQKITNPPVITVLNSTGGPLTVVKTLCVTSGVSSTPQFTLVNTAPLTVTNVVGKAPTITLLNAPVTVVKTLSAAQHQQQQQQLQQLQASHSLQQQQYVGGEKIADVTTTSGNNVVQSPTGPTIIENRAHNVFVKNTCPDSTVPDVPQGHKLLTANNFPSNNVLTNISSNIKTINGQRSKLKIVSNVLIPGPSQVSATNVVLNKVPPQMPSSSQNIQQRIVSRTTKVLGQPTTAKYLTKAAPANNLSKPIGGVNNPSPNLHMKHTNEKQQTPQPQSQQQQQRLMYPTHKSQIKTLPPVNNFVQKMPGIKTLSPQSRNIPGQMQRTGSGLRTIPPQRPQKMLSNKLNYIGKHAVQAQKVKHAPGGRYKNVKHHQGPTPYNSYQPQIIDKQLTFNQALTAEILETLSNNKSGPTSSYSNKNYEIMPNRYESHYTYPEHKPVMEPVMKPYEEKSKSGLDALSLICQAVLLDHNYNATLPPDSPTKSAPIPNTPSQINGMLSSSMYSPPGSVKRRSLPSSNAISSCSSIASMSLMPSNNTSLTTLRDDDAASDISDISDRKHDTEGEETDTAPEAEAVSKEDPFDHYGDYVTRCICGYLHDDGYMVECDRCKVWQHVQCVVKNRQVPDEFLCEQCDPSKPVDSHKARLIQQQWVRERQLPDLKLRKEIKTKELLKMKDSDSDSSDAENSGHNNNTIVPKGRGPIANRRKGDKPSNVRQKREVKEPAAPRKQFKKRERRIVKRKTKAQMKVPQQTEAETNQDVFSSTHLPQLRQWIENYEEAVTNHYSPELRARISSIRVNGAHSDVSINFDTSVSKCRVHTQPLTDIKYIVSAVNLAPNSPVIELRGKYMLSTQHRNSGGVGGGALTTRQHAQRPGPFLFFYRLHRDNTEVCVDTRTYGNSARFVRRSCKPNAELRHCIEKGVLHLYVVTIVAVEKNVELTIKHESHDLASIGTTQIACYCGNSDECTINKSSIKKNGEATEVQRKRRGRRTISTPTVTEPDPLPVKVKEELPVSPPPPPPPLLVKEETPVKLEKLEPVEVKIKKEEIEMKNETPPVEIKVEIKDEKVEIKEEQLSSDSEQLEKPAMGPETTDTKSKETKEESEEDEPPPPKKAAPTTPISTRRSSHHKAEKDETKEVPTPSQKLEKGKSKKLSREERKLEAILRAIEQMEKADQRKQEHKNTKQTHRRESEPAPVSKDEEKPVIEPKQRRRRRKGRARTTSTHSISTRRDRLNSGDSCLTSGDENMLSPNDGEGVGPAKPNMSCSLEEMNSSNSKDVSLLAVMSNNEKSPPREIMDSNSNSANSSPETPLSLACSLVQAAVEPMEPGFKFPKTKKVLMNEWLNKTPETHHTISPMSTHITTSTEFDTSTGFYTSKSIVGLPTTPTSAGFDSINQIQPRGSAKKRWLMQAISEDKCDSPLGRSDSPPLDTVAPPKKRRLPRESISNDNSPPTTPTTLGPPINSLEDQLRQQENCSEMLYGSVDNNSSSQPLESETSALLDRVAELKQNFAGASPNDVLKSQSDMSPMYLSEREVEIKQKFVNCVVAAAAPPPIDVLKPHARSDMLPICLADPRLASREHHPLFSNSDHLVGTVEKTLSIFGFEDRRAEPITPAKRKLSINEYRQRKKLNNNDSGEKSEDGQLFEDGMLEETNSSESFKQVRARSNSTSSTSSTTSSDEEVVPAELPSKAPAFNSEPTELERQREMSSLRLKKAFGLSIDVEPRKPVLSVEAILNSYDGTPVIKPEVLTSTNDSSVSGGGEESFLKSTSSSQSTTTLSKERTPSPVSASPRRESTEDDDKTVEEEDDSVVDKIESDKEEELLDGNEDEEVDEEEEEEVEEEEEEESADTEEDDSAKPHLFYTPDEDEVGSLAEVSEEKCSAKIESVSYVPPFNNPVYPSTSFSCVIDEDGRYEGRNPSPPPNLESQSADDET